jgi:phenylacetate-CoA ligase
MKYLLALKRLAEGIPYPFGRLTSHVPHSLRLGPQYQKFCNLIESSKAWGIEQSAAYSLAQLNIIVRFAQNNIPFYTNLYGKSPLKFQTIAQFQDLPTINKDQARELSEYCTEGMKVNTGGTSGQPLSLSLDSHAWAREWAHIHAIWRNGTYRPTGLMMTFLGKDLYGKLFQYNAVHHEFRINPYIFSRKCIPEIIGLFDRYPFEFFQGYPSSTYEFFNTLEKSINPKDKKIIQSKIKCILFSSEFPSPYIKQYLENVWGFKMISWYGHSEMCLIARDIDCENIYTHYPTYGFAENINGVLHGTSFHNFAMPLIRYSTGDHIQSSTNELGEMLHFSITEGREGDFVIDQFGNRLSLTALVFGRHHTIFDLANFVQVHQPEPGRVTFLVSIPSDKADLLGNALTYFDLESLPFIFDYRYISKPVLSSSGKFKFKLTESDLETSQTHIIER